jgi:hypothetical protein
VREEACIGAATMLQPWTLRLILNAAALAAASPTLLFRVECRAWVECRALGANARDCIGFQPKLQQPHHLPDQIDRQRSHTD